MLAVRSAKGAVDTMGSSPREFGRGSAEHAKVYIYIPDHEHDGVYAENVVQYLESQGVLCRSITLRADGLRPELQLPLDDCPTAVLSFNAALDHSWLDSGSFLAAAEASGVPVLQWILDHPSSRWHEFYASTATNSRFLLNTDQEQQYFQTYCLPGAATATLGGVGPNRRSRIGRLTRQEFMRRRVACIIPLGLRRLSHMMNGEAMSALEAPMADITREAIASAQFDLTGMLHQHLTATLAAHNKDLSAPTFNALCHIVEQSVQTIRRLKIFDAARKFPVLVQSDDTAKPHFNGTTAATLETNVTMQFTLARMPRCRSVLSVSPMSDMIHDRTMNALNGGSVAILEDTSLARSMFTHGRNALLFRYNDDSIEECLDIVCNQPDHAYEIALAGMALRDDPKLRFGKFHNILDLARRGISPAGRY